MPANVKVPTILRTYTGGQKLVPGAGTTLAEVIDDVDSTHSGIKERLVDGEELRRFINVYVNDEDVRFTGGLGTSVKDGDTVVILPAVAGGALAAPAGETRPGNAR
jgi:molybdopterin converting factor small subunit